MRVINHTEMNFINLPLTHEILLTEDSREASTEAKALTATAVAASLVAAAS